jgi:tRNA threonylcarbamoyladenosine biosynthesis protein TsaE
MPFPREFVTDSDDATIALGRRLAAEVRAPLVILLLGDMGAGKTTFSKGLISGLGVAKEEDVASPTFTLVHQYGPEPLVYHVDLYRIEPGRDLETLGLDDVWDYGQKAVILIEWGEKATGLFRGPRWELHFEDLGGDRRRISLSESTSESTPEST